MNIKNHISDFFQNLAQGIILDNAYDLYLRNRYIDYVDKFNINYISSQDIDMNMLKFFPNIEFLTVPPDAENLHALYNLKKLKGIEIFARCFDDLDLTKFENLEYLLVQEQPQNIHQLEHCKKLKHLKCSQWDSTDVSDLKSICTLRSLELEFCGKLQSLNGIQNLIGLEKVTICYCLKLRQIEGLKKIKDSLKHFILEDCNKVEDLFTIESLCSLEFLILSNFETRVVNKLPSVGFINEMPFLKTFMTDYKIEDGDLTPLLKVKNVDILKFYRHYNLNADSFAQ